MTELGAKLKKLEVCWSIKGQNAQIQNQGPKWKGGQLQGCHLNLTGMQLNWFLKLKSQLKTWLNK